MAQPSKDSYVPYLYPDDPHTWDFEQTFRRGEEAPEYSPGDEAIKEKVCAVIFRDRLFDENEVTVSVKEGVVTLNGLVFRSQNQGLRRSLHRRHLWCGRYY